MEDLTNTNVNNELYDKFYNEGYRIASNKEKFKKEKLKLQSSKNIFTILKKYIYNIKKI